MAKNTGKESAPRSVVQSAHGKRGSSVDELEAIVRLKLQEIQPSNAGAHDVWIPRFLKALSLSANWSLSARVAGVDESTPSKRADSDPDFAAAAVVAERQAGQLLEAAAYKSAVYGDLRPIYHQGVFVGEEVVYSDRMRELLLKATFPEKYRERVSVDNTVRHLPTPMSAEERRALVVELLPQLSDYARFLQAKPITDL